MLSLPDISVSFLADSSASLSPGKAGGFWSREPLKAAAGSGNTPQVLPQFRNRVRFRARDEHDRHDVTFCTATVGDLNSQTGPSGFLLFVCLAAHDSEGPGELPEMSNCYCHPGKAGGSPLVLEAAIRFNACGAETERIGLESGTKMFKREHLCSTAQRLPR